MRALLSCKIPDKFLFDAITEHYPNTMWSLARLSPKQYFGKAIPTKILNKTENLRLGFNTGSRRFFVAYTKTITSSSYHKAISLREMLDHLYDCNQYNLPP